MEGKGGIAGPAHVLTDFQWSDDDRIRRDGFDLRKEEFR